MERKKQTVGTGQNGGVDGPSTPALCVPDRLLLYATQQKIKETASSRTSEWTPRPDDRDCWPAALLAVDDGYLP
jgi:hypothetical protein